MQIRFALLWSSICAATVAAAHGCISTEEVTPPPASGTTSTSAGGGGGEGGCGVLCGTGNGGTGGEEIGVLDLSPSNPKLYVVEDVAQTQDFTATLGGKDVSAEVTWTFERPTVGAMTGATFTPTGEVGGPGRLTARMAGAEGSTIVEVHITKTVRTLTLTSSQEAALEEGAGGPDPDLSFLYPYDQTVFPLGVLAPELQWNGAKLGDLYRLRLSSKYYEYTEYFDSTVPGRHIVPQQDWDAIEESGTGAQADPLEVYLSRISAGLAYDPVKQTYRIAQGRLKGSIYYWQLPDDCPGGATDVRIVRMRPDSDVVEEFFNPGGCWGCHTVSRDGTKMAAEFGDYNKPLLTLDLAANPVDYGSLDPQSPGGNYMFSAFNDDGDRLLASKNGTLELAAARLEIVDVATGDVLNDNALGSGCGEPAWSPDGKQIAGICGLTGTGYVHHSGTGNLVVADVADDGMTVSNVQTIVPKSAGQGRPAYPSFSPGSEWIAFGRPTSGSLSSGSGELWLVAPDGTGAKKLHKASNDNKSYNPVFAPVRAGGFFWIAFMSRRDYGNTIVGAARQQLWITAIDDPPTIADPSHPPFYLRGQQACARSENAYFAIDPCKPQGAGCETGLDCCDGQCIVEAGTGEHVCGAPAKPGQCSEDGNGCKTNADCCRAPLSFCEDGFCQKPIAQ